MNKYLAVTALALVLMAPVYAHADDADNATDNKMIAAPADTGAGDVQAPPAAEPEAPPPPDATPPGDGADNPPDDGAAPPDDGNGDGDKDKDKDKDAPL